MPPLVQFIFLGLLTTGINSLEDSIGIPMVKNSMSTFPVFCASREPTVTKRYGLGSLVPYPVPRSASAVKLFGASSNNYPMSIQHKIPHLAKALGNTRYVTIAQDPTLVQPWKTSSERWTSAGVNEIAHGPQRETGHHTILRYEPNQPPVQEEHQPQHHHLREKHQGDASPEQVRHKTYFSQLPPDAREISDSPESVSRGPSHDRGRNKKIANQFHEPRLPPAIRPVDSDAPVDRHVQHVHYHSRKHRQRLSTRPSESYEDEQTSRRDPKDWSINLRYGHKNREEPCRDSAQEQPPSPPSHAPLRRPMGYESLRQQSQHQRQQRQQQQQQKDQQQQHPRHGQEERLGKGREDQHRWNLAEHARSRQGEQPRSRQENQVASRNGRQSDNLSWRSTSEPANEQRARYNDFPILRARWSNHPYQSQESQTIPEVQMVHDRPEWEAIEQTYRDYRANPHARKIIKNNRTTILEEEFEKLPHNVNFDQPLGQSEYRYAGFPSYEQNDWFHQRQNADAQDPSHYYLTPKQESRDVDIEEILSDDEEADVGIVAIGNKLPNKTDTNRANRSQDFLMNGELRFPDQNAAGLRELTQLLKTAPEKQRNYTYNRNGTRGQVLWTTKNVAITRETFVDGRYDDRTPVPHARERNSWTPLPQSRSHVPQPTERASPDRAQRTSVPPKPKRHPKTTDARTQPPALRKSLRQEESDHAVPSRQKPEQRRGPSAGTRPQELRTDAERALLHDTGPPSQGVLRKRIKKIQTHSTIEVLPMSIVNHTESPSYDIDESSEEEDNDYPLSGEHEDPDYYQQGVPDSQPNRTTELAPTQNPPTSQPKSITTPAPVEANPMSARKPLKLPTKVTGVLALPTMFTRKPLATKGLEETTVSKKSTTSGKLQDRLLTAAKPLKLFRSQKFLSQNQPEPTKSCNNKNCQLRLKPLAYQRLVGRTTVAPRVAFTTTTTKPPVPSKGIPSLTRRSSHATTGTKKRTTRRRRKIVTASPSKESAPMTAATNAQPSTLKNSLGLPAKRQFLKRKASEDELQEPQPTVGSEDERRYRVQFHMQGFSGPESYRYGFHTADPYNPLERFEERDGTGRVRGHYSYIDPNGKRVIVNYAADQNGFQIVRGNRSYESNGGTYQEDNDAAQNGIGENENDQNSAANENAEVGGDGGSKTGPSAVNNNDNAI